MTNSFELFLEDTREALDAVCIAAGLYEATAKLTRRDLQGSYELTSGDMVFEHYDTCDDQLTMVPVITVRYNNGKDKVALNKEIDKMKARLRLEINKLINSEYGRRDDVFDVQLTAIEEPETDKGADSKLIEVQITIIAYITRGI